MPGDDAPEPGYNNRLAEMVEELTGADHGASLHAVREHASADAADALEVVARAMVEVDQPPALRVSPAFDGLGEPHDPDAPPDGAVHPDSTD